MPAIRAFIAIELPIDIQKKLNELIKNLQSKIHPSVIHWVNASNIHLTLKFLGDVRSTDIDTLIHILIDEAIRHPPFQLELESLGAFPNFHHSRVIWVGLTTPKELINLQQGIEKSVGKMGFPLDDRPFSPHLTLGRITQSATPVQVKQVGGIISSLHAEKLGSFNITSVHLFRSDLTPNGSIYTRLATAALSR